MSATPHPLSPRMCHTLTSAVDCCALPPPTRPPPLHTLPPPSRPLHTHKQSPSMHQPGSRPVGRAPGAPTPFPIKDSTTHATLGSPHPPPAHPHTPLSSNISSSPTPRPLCCLSGCRCVCSGCRSLRRPPPCPCPALTCQCSRPFDLAMQLWIRLPLPRHAPATTQVGLIQRGRAHAPQLLTCASVC